MSLSHETGPLVVTGNVNPQQLTEWEEGPSCFADGTAVVDPRWASGTLGAQSGQVKTAYAIPQTNALLGLDVFPTSGATNNVVSAQGAGGAAGTSLTLATGTVQSAVSNVPVVPWVKAADLYGNTLWTQQAYIPANVVTAGLALDFGCAAGTTFTSSTQTLSSALGIGNGVYPPQFAGQTVQKSQIITLQTTNHVQPELMFVPGQWIIVANAGNAGGTIPLVTQIQAVDYVNHMLYTTTPALAAITNGGIANANLYSAQPGIAYWPYVGAGAVAVADARHMCSRILRYISSSASDTSASTITVTGYDVFGIPMTETIQLNGTTAVFGKKAFKFINKAVIGGTTLVGNISIGTQGSATAGDAVVGIPYRADAFSYLTLFFNDAGVTANTGFTKVDLTSPATAISGDVRGTYALGSDPGGNKRLTIWIDPATAQWDAESNLTPFALFGSAQF